MNVTKKLFAKIVMVISVLTLAFITTPVIAGKYASSSDPNSSSGYDGASASSGRNSSTYDRYNSTNPAVKMNNGGYKLPGDDSRIYSSEQQAENSRRSSSTCRDCGAK